jgi:hypothetical protein
MRLFQTLMLTLCIAASTVAGAQTSPVPAEKVEKREAKVYTTYMLTYNIYELENGKRVNTRTHKIVLSDNNASAESKSEMRAPLPGTNPVEYVNTGMVIRARLQRTDAEPLLTTNMRMEFLAGDETQLTARPVVHTAEAEAIGNVKLDKPMLLAGIEDQQSKKSYQVEVTVTKQ